MPPQNAPQGEEIGIAITFNGNPVDGVEVYVDGEARGSTAGGAITLKGIPAGDHQLEFFKAGFAVASAAYTVSAADGIITRDVHEMLSDSQRATVIAQGKVNLRYYYTPGCSVCRRVEPDVTALAKQYSDCLVLEKLCLWRYSQELRGQFVGMPLPIIEVEGRGGAFQSEGYITDRKLASLVNAAGCR